VLPVFGYPSLYSLQVVKKTLFMLGGCLLAAGAVQAQTSPNADPATTSAQQLAQDLGVERIRFALTPNTADFRNSASLQQMGTGNTAVINQTNQAILANQAGIQQTGTGNVLNLTQTGSNNQTGFSQQGSGNNILGQVAGDNNTIDATQQGTGNQYSTQLTGNQGRYTIEQLGNNNSLTQRETSTTTPLPGYNVKMEGSNMHITVEQGKVFP
jgi:hypothetical protein